MGFSHDQNLKMLVNKWLQFFLLWDLMMVRRREKDLQFVSRDSMMAKRNEEKAISFSNGIW